MRKLFAPLILSLFFFLPLKVYGASYSVTLDSSVYTIFEEPGFCEFYHSIVDNNTNYIFTLQNTYSNNISTFLYRYDTEHFTSGMIGTASWGGGQYGIVYNTNPTTAGFYWKWFSLPNFTESFGDNQQHTMYNYTANGSLTKKWILVIDSSLVYTTSGSDIYTLTIGNDSITFGSQQTITTAPTLLDMYKLSHSDPTICSVSPPTPPDNTPLLTTFYTVVIDKIGEICTFFTSNYLYLTVFVIFLFYISILLLRRFIK